MYLENENVMCVDVGQESLRAPRGQVEIGPDWVMEIVFEKAAERSYGSRPPVQTIYSYRTSILVISINRLDVGQATREHLRWMNRRDPLLIRLDDTDIFSNPR
jgi:hypothetical protein